MKHLSINILAIFIISVMTVACSNSHTAKNTAIKSEISSMMDKEVASDVANFDYYLALNNAQLAKRVTISALKASRVQALLDIELELSSRYEKSQRLQFQFNWFDQKGKKLEPNITPWQTMILPSQQSIQLHGVAPNVTARTFNLYLRPIPSKSYKDRELKYEGNYDE